MTQGKKTSIDRETLELLTESFSDTQIAGKLNLAVSTVFTWRRKYQIPSFSEKTGNKQARRSGKILTSGTGVPHKQVLSKESTYFESIDSPNKAYFLGLLAADGSVNTERDKYFSIELKSPDYCVLELLTSEMNTSAEVKLYRREDKNNTTYGRLRVYNSVVVEQLKSLGLTGDNTKNEGYWQLSSSLKADYLRGLLDGDGCIKEKTKTLNFGSCSESLSKLVSHWAEEYLGTPCSMTTKILKSGKPFYTVTFGGKPKTVLTWLYDNNRVSLPRKKKEAMRWVSQRE